MADFTPLLLSLILSLVHLYSEHFSKLMERYHAQIVSFSSGILIAIIFLYLLPEVTALATFDIYTLILLGFVLFHLTEKYLYQHVTDKKKRLHELAELHILGFFVDHFMVGVTLVLTAQLFKSLSIILFIPFLLHTVSSSMSLKHIHERSKTHFNKLLLSASTLIGALVVSFSAITGNLFVGLLAFAIGLLLYIVIRDMLPKGKSGDSRAFFLGVLLVVLTNLLTLQL